MTDCPQGIPDDLYDMPGHFGGENYLKPVDATLWMQAMLSDAHPAAPMFTDDIYRNIVMTLFKHSSELIFRDKSQQPMQLKYINLSLAIFDHSK